MNATHRRTSEGKTNREAMRALKRHDDLLDVEPLCARLPGADSFERGQLSLGGGSSLGSACTDAAVTARG